MHEARHRSTRRNPRYLHIVRRVAPSSGGHVVFVMGPLVSSPSLTHHAAGLGLLFVVDVTPPLHAIRQTERANLGCTWSRLLSAQHPHVRLYSIQRPCDGTSLSKSCWPSVIPPGPIGIRRRPQPASDVSLELSACAWWTGPERSSARRRWRANRKRWLPGSTTPASSSLGLAWKRVRCRNGCMPG